jgi:hypothetical protein
MSGLETVFEALVQPVKPRTDLKPRWATAAGFKSRLEAESAGCVRANSGEFMHGKRIEIAESLQSPVVHDAGLLLRTEVRPVNYVIPGWLPEGLTVLAASPKIGKTTLAMQIILALVSGGAFWNSEVPKGKALMIDLETNERRLRRKLEQAGVQSLDLDTLSYATEWPRGLLGVQKLAEFLDAHPDVRLVVIDTLQRFRDSGSGKQNVYAADYEALAPLQQLCKERPGLSIFVIHHKRKAASDDPIDSINGSAAIAGAADGVWLMSRKGSDYTLHIQARDWERDEDEFRIARDGGAWSLVGGPRCSQNEAEVLKLLEVSGGMTAPQLAIALSIGRQAAYERLNRMRARGLVRRENDLWNASLSE